MNSMFGNEKLLDNNQDIIEDDNLICAKSTILKGSTIGKGFVMMADAVATKSTPQYEIWLCSVIPSEKVF